MHAQLRDSLAIVQEAAVQAGSRGGAQHATRELLLFCHGFCTALTGHHDGEDRHLFPAIAAAHPELRDTLRYLQQDHSMIAHLIGGLQAAMTATQDSAAADLARHLDGPSAIMESHFRYEERELLQVLDSLHLEADPAQVFGPL